MVTAAEVAQIIAEMGPVTAGPGAGTGEQNGADGAKPEGGAAAATAPPPKRLYRIPDGAMIAGVCSGLAAYFQIDVTLVRIGFVVLALLTKGVGILIYVAMMFLVPEANTPEERAAAGGMPFNAKEVVDRVKREYEKGSKHWTREWRRKQRRWRRAALVGRGRPPPPPWLAAVVPLFGLVHLILFLDRGRDDDLARQHRGDSQLAEAAGRAALGGCPDAVLRVIRSLSLRSGACSTGVWRSGARCGAGWFAFWHAVIWMIGLAIAFWVASDHIPEITEFMQRLPHLFREVDVRVARFRSCSRATLR